MLGFVPLCVAICNGARIGVVQYISRVEGREESTPKAPRAPRKRPGSLQRVVLSGCGGQVYSYALNGMISFYGFSLYRCWRI